MDTRRVEYALFIISIIPEYESHAYLLKIGLEFRCERQHIVAMPMHYKLYYLQRL